MPTGYTHPVKDGEITDLRDFILLCSRAMGARIMERDNALGVSLPEHREPCVERYETTIREATARLAELKAMTAEQIADAAQRAYLDAEEMAIEYRAGCEETVARYRAMLAKVQQWTPPSDHHEGLKRFMVDQLEESIRFDGPSDFLTPKHEDYEPATWHRKEIERANRSLANAHQWIAEEVERCADQNAWVDALVAALPEPETEPVVS